MMSEKWNWSAVKMAAAIKSGEVSAREAVEAALRRLEVAEPTINAFEEVFDDALHRADLADEAIARGDNLGPLHGVPIALKANHDIQGRPTTHGVPAFAQLPAAAESAPPVARYIESGAIVIGRTRMPPFGMRWTTQSEFYGATRNPHDPTVTAGGSSGGAAAAVAAGVVPLAQGNDIGGSLRYPASVCGVVALRPTVGKVPWFPTPDDVGMLPAQREFQVDGPIARDIADLRLALSVVAKFDPRDPDATPEYNADAPHGRPRIGVVTDPGSSAFAGISTPEVEAATRAAADQLQSEGYEIDEITTPLFGEAAGLWCQLALADFVAAGFEAQLDEYADEGMRFKWHTMRELTAEAYGPIDLKAYIQGHARRSQIRRKLSELMAEYPVLLLPNSGEPPFTLGDDVTSKNRTHQLVKHQWPNLAIPVLALPAVGLATSARQGKAPLGVQLVGRAFAENTILDVAETLQKVSPVQSPVDPPELP